jgi:riboflavin synthase
MFTGLIVAVGTVRELAPAGAGMEIRVDLPGLPGPVRVGDSIALSGVCCTVVAWQPPVADFHLTPETLDRTWFRRARPGMRVNVEPALRAGDPLGGHLVQGHVDGLAETVAAIDPVQGGELLVRVSANLQRYCVEKGSITLDGVSLTLAGRHGDALKIAVIPHTAQHTTLAERRPGDPLHVEVDVIAKYVEQMLAARGLA